MQFVANGPDVPETLLQAHEEGGVVFFCGAGISYPAGLPLFKGLVSDIFDRLGTAMNGLEKSAFEREQYDVTLDLLERRHRGGRLAVRSKLAESLRPNLRRAGSTAIHESLLHLARDRSGALRLLTTNFDRIFEVVAKRLKLRHQVYSAPSLPIPKNSRWDGLVYLHGLQPEKANEAALNRLIVTSGDFGLAYLTERWAARFVSELFRNYVVCFVGYSINDPVLRYMMDALAADRSLGEQTPQAYAFGSCKPGAESETADEWRAKGVEPVLYAAASDAKGNPDHSALPKTFQAWARTYREGALGKESIVVEYALANPSENTPQDDFVGRMLWALSDARGLSAKRFADMQPCPPLTWLSAFSETRFCHGDLNRFGVPPHTAVDERLRFSLITRPAPYQCAPWMSVSAHRASPSQWDEVMRNLARWLNRHLNDPTLFQWLVAQGPHPHPALVWEITNELNQQAKLKADGNTAELDRIRERSPSAVAGPTMRTLWGVCFSGRLKHRMDDPDLFDWMERLAREGLTSLLRQQLRRLLSPQLAIKKPWMPTDIDATPSDRQLVRQTIDWDFVLAAEHIRSTLREDDERAALTPFLPDLLPDFQALLHDALELMIELGDANEHSDRSYWDLPSILSHAQNNYFDSWVFLIELVRDAWIAIRVLDQSRATSIAQGWFALPFATFKRLALFSASQENTIAPSQWVSWLLADGRRWLWLAETMRECMRLLVLQGGGLQPNDQALLEAAVLDGPPRELFRDDVSVDAWSSLADHSTWLHLAKLESGGVQLGFQAKQRFDELSASNPQFRLAEDESDEFSHWSGGSFEAEDKMYRDTEPAPQTRAELVVWLQRPAGSETEWFESSWPERCRTHLDESALALQDLAAKKVWPPARWRDALQTWSDDAHALRSWSLLATTIENMPSEVVRIVVQALSRWLDVAVKSIELDDAAFLPLCDRILAVKDYGAADLKDILTGAINHAVGLVTQALIVYWFKRNPNDDDGVPEDVEPFFARLADVGNQEFRHGRVILASRLLAFFRVDRTWTERLLLPLFDWSTDVDEARAAWSGFLWSPRLYPPLLVSFKKQFLATADHYTTLGERGRQYVGFLTYAALDPVDGYTTLEFQHAFEVLEQDGLEHVVQTLVQAQEGAADRREGSWQSRLQPFWQKIWPKDQRHASADMADPLARLCIAAGNEFPSAVHTLFNWLSRTERWGHAARLLHRDGLDTKFPQDSLQLLHAIVNEKGWPYTYLRDCLIAIETAAPDLKSDPEFIRLDEYCRLRNM